MIKIFLRGLADDIGAFSFLMSITAIGFFAEKDKLQNIDP